MPEKDGSDDKKSTKSVVNKKQKQLMNKEQLDLTSVAESFGGQIVGEPVELDEFRTGNPVIDGVVTAGIAGQKVGKWLDNLVKPKLLPSTIITPKPSDTVTIDGKEYKRNKDGAWQLYTQDELETKKDDKTEIKPEIKPIKPVETPIKPIEEPETKPETEPETEPKPEIDQLKDKKKNKVLVKPTDTDTKTDTNTSTTTLPLPLLNKIKTRLKTKTRTGKPVNIRGLPKLPGTAHNVGKRVNPQ